MRRFWLLRGHWRLLVLALLFMLEWVGVEIKLGLGHELGLGT